MSNSFGDFGQPHGDLSDVVVCGQVGHRPFLNMSVRRSWAFTSHDIPNA